MFSIMELFKFFSFKEDNILEFFIIYIIIILIIFSIYIFFLINLDRKNKIKIYLKNKNLNYIYVNFLIKEIKSENTKNYIILLNNEKLFCTFIKRYMKKIKQKNISKHKKDILIYRMFNIYNIIFSNKKNDIIINSARIIKENQLLTITKNQNVYSSIVLKNQKNNMIITIPKNKNNKLVLFKNQNINIKFTLNKKIISFNSKYLKEFKQNDKKYLIISHSQNMKIVENKSNLKINIDWNISFNKVYIKETIKKIIFFKIKNKIYKVRNKKYEANIINISLSECLLKISKDIQINVDDILYLDFSIDNHNIKSYCSVLSYHISNNESNNIRLSFTDMSIADKNKLGILIYLNN